MFTTGFSHTCGNVVTDDDSIILEVDLQLADCLIATNNTNLMASFGLKVASFVAIGDQAVTVIRTGSEQPVFNITAQTNSTRWVDNPANPVLVVNLNRGLVN